MSGFVARLGPAIAALALAAALAGCRGEGAGPPAPPPLPASPAATRSPPGPSPAEAGAEDAAAAAAEGLPEPQYLPAVDLAVGLVRFRAEVARTLEERRRGLMARRDVTGDRGMLFVFPDTAVRRFWMKNTPLPLSIAFIDEGGAVAEIRDLEPFDLSETVSARPARYALEMARGWFERKGVRAGDRIHGLAEAGSAED